MLDYKKNIIIAFIIYVIGRSKGYMRRVIRLTLLLADNLVTVSIGYRHDTKRKNNGTYLVPPRLDIGVNPGSSVHDILASDHYTTTHSAK